MKDLLKNNYVILGLLMLVLAITNPDYSDHTKAVVDKTVESIKAKNAGVYLETLSIYMINTLAPIMVQRDNYVILSITKFKRDEEYKVVGVGILGKVYLFGDEFN